MPAVYSTLREDGLVIMYGVLYTHVQRDSASIRRMVVSRDEVSSDKGHRALYLTVDDYKFMRDRIIGGRILAEHSPDFGVFGRILDGWLRDRKGHPDEMELVVKFGLYPFLVERLESIIQKPIEQAELSICYRFDFVASNTHPGKCTIGFKDFVEASLCNDAYHEDCVVVEEYAAYTARGALGGGGGGSVSAGGGQVVAAPPAHQSP